MLGPHLRHMFVYLLKDRRKAGIFLQHGLTNFLFMRHPFFMVSPAILLGGIGTGPLFHQSHVFRLEIGIALQRLLAGLHEFIPVGWTQESQHPGLMVPGRRRVLVIAVLRGKISESEK